MPSFSGNTSKSPTTIKCEDTDSDVTFISGCSKRRNGMNGDGSLEKRAKEKKKQRKNDSVTENMFTSPNENGYVPPFADESFSESILKVKKKKKKHKNKTHDENEHNCNVQSNSFLNDINLTQSLETDDSLVNDTTDKRKKKKLKQHEDYNPLKKRKRKESIEFQTENIFKEPEADNYIYSTSTPKKLKKKYREKGDLGNKIFSNDEKDETVSMNSVDNSRSEINRVHENTQNGSLRNLNKRKGKSGESNVNSERHTGDLENSLSSSSNDSEIITTNKTPKKKKSCDKEVGQNSQNEEHNEDSMKKSANDSPILKKNKKKRKDISDFDPWQDSISSEFSVKSEKNKKDIDPLHVSILSESNSSKNVRKESKESVLEKAGVSYGYVDYEMKMADSKEKLGLYSPSHSATVGTSSIQAMYDCDNVGKSKSTDVGNTSYINNILFTDGPKGSDKECSFSSEDEDSDVKITDSKFETPLLGKYFDVDFTVPVLHKILNRASKPTAVQREQIAIKGIKVKQGKFVKAEDKQIRENWKYFIEVSGLKDQPEYFFRLDNQYISPASKRNFLYYLARNMPERTPYAVYKRFKLLMAERKKGRYTSEENEFIKKMMKQKEGRGYCVKKIAEQLQRPVASVEKRIKKIEEAHTRKIKWKSSNAAAFIKYLLKVTKIPEENITQLKKRPIAHNEWEALSKKLDNVPVRILKRVWLEKLYPALFIPEHFCDLGQVKLKLVRMLHENNETDWKLVNWNRYASKFEGLTSLRIYTLMKQFVKTFVPEHKRDNLKRCIRTLMKISDKSVHSQVIHKLEYTRGTVRESREKT